MAVILKNIKNCHKKCVLLDKTTTSVLSIHLLTQVSYKIRIMPNKKFSGITEINYVWLIFSYDTNRITDAYIKSRRKKMFATN